jgi:hypothetical protein
MPRFALNDATMSALIDYHMDVTLRRQVVGLRWDYARRQAMTCELSHAVSLSQRAFEVRVQWSAAIP